MKPAPDPHYRHRFPAEINADFDLYRRHTERTTAPAKPFNEAALVSEDHFAPPMLPAQTELNLGLN